MKIVKEYVFEGIEFQTRICKECKEEFDTPASTSNAKCRNCRLGIKKSISSNQLRPYKKRGKN